MDLTTVREFVHALIVALSVVNAALLAIEKLLGGTARLTVVKAEKRDATING